MSGFAPPEALSIITDQIQKIRDAKPAGLLTFGIATAVWSSSPAMTAIWTWKTLQWPVVFALACTGIAMVYYFAPDAEQDWVWLTRGSVCRQRSGCSRRWRSSITWSTSRRVPPRMGRSAA